MIKAIFFDFDGVLTLNNSGTAQTSKYLSEATGIGYDLIYQAFKCLKSDVTLGYKEYSDILPQVNELIGYDIDSQLLENAFLSTPKNDKMFELVKSLRSRGYKTGIITDNPLERINALEKTFNLSSIIDSITVSSSVHSTKNGEVIFESALNSLDVKPFEAVFIDNSEKNLEIPSKMGMNTLYYDDKKNNIGFLISNLENLIDINKKIFTKTSNS